MRKILIFNLLVLSQLFWGPAWADETPLPGAPSTEQTARLDRLFIDLKTAPNEQLANETEQKIWIEWTTPEDPELAHLMGQALAARRVADYEKALAVLDQMVVEWPGYAEGWNQRATVYFLKGEIEKSLEDIAETLVREPRHFGALAGRGMIRLRQTKPALAVQNFLAAMEFHPYLRERGIIAALMNGG